MSKKTIEIPPGSVADYELELRRKVEEDKKKRELEKLADKFVDESILVKLVSMKKFLKKQPTAYQQKLRKRGEE